MSNNIMVDIETLGTSKNSVILSIGAVQFNENGVEKNFYVQIDPESCTDYGLQIDARTVMWWMDQNVAARQHLTSSRGINLPEALDQFIDAFEWNDAVVWANGIDFDFTILEEAMKATGRTAPWAYWAKMDYRTIKNIVPRDVYNASKEEAGVAHHALADATAQAATLVQLLSWINRNTEIKAKERKRG